MSGRVHPESQDQRLISLAEASEVFGVSVKTLRRRIADGTVHGYRVGRLIRVDLYELRDRLMIEMPSARRRR